MVAAPDPDECIGQGLLENAAVTMASAEAEHETLGVTFGFQSRRRALASHDPIVMSFLRIFWAQVVFRDVSEDPQRLPLAILNQFHVRMIFPGAQRIFRYLRRVLVLLSDKGAGIGDDTAEPIGPEPAHR